MYRRLVLVALAVLSTGCLVGPNYRRPTVTVPPAFRAPAPLPPAEAESLADTKWFAVFRDEALQALIRQALERNYDLREAVTRVESARAVLGITRADQYPNIGVGAGIETNRVSRNGAASLPPEVLPSQNRTFGAVTANLLTFEVDLWGRLRRATEAARANLLSAEENRQAVVSTLVAEVATQYLTLRELDYVFEISRQTLQTRQESLALTQSRQAGGVSTLLDLRQAEQLVYTAAQSIPTIQQEREQRENRINLILGLPPGSVQRGRSLTEQGLAPEVPSGLTSALLERRPDIRAAEQDLVAANAQIGVAKAEYFPRLTLTGALGGASTQLTSLFSPASTTWNLASQLAQPIFTAGRIKSGVRLADSEYQRALVRYERTVQTAFTEVSDALIAHQRLRESREQQELLVHSLEDRVRLAYLRYRGGVDTQLNALDADRDLFQAQLDLAGLRLQELLAVVQLYKALGGGWQ